jgi:hypothetical protein
MNENYIKLSWAFLCISLISCITQVSVPIRTAPEQLVVEGWVTTDSVPYTINLSYSGPYTSAGVAQLDSSKFFITDAKVTIEDNLGDSTDCPWIGLGTYQSSDSAFVGTVGRTYTLKIYLSNGKTYISKPEMITPVAAIDSLTAIYDTAQSTQILPPPLIVSVHTHDPAGSRNYYRWTSLGYVPRKSYGDTCPVFGMPPCQNPYDCGCAAICVQYNADNQIAIQSNQFIAGREIIQQVYYSPLYWFGNHFVQVNQYSISQDAYQFWQQYVAQTNRTGSILDPLPAPLIGNIYNQADSTEFALGLFEASAVSSKKIVFVPFFLQQYLLESLAGQYILKGDCQAVYPGALPDLTDPPGWANAQVVNLY